MTPPMATCTASPLLALPAELRNRIFELLYATDDVGNGPPPMSRSPLALSYTCRQLYHETQALAFPRTIFRIRYWNGGELLLKLQRVQSHLHPSIRRVELTNALSNFSARRAFLYGLNFADAGLPYLEELVINVTLETNPSSTHKSKQVYSIANLSEALWKTVAVSRNDRLKKVCVVHGGLVPGTIAQLWKRMEEHRPITFQFQLPPSQIWTTKPRFNAGGQCHFTLRMEDGSQRRAIGITIGRTYREAEMWHQVRQELLEGNILSNVTARQPDGVNAADLDNETLLMEIDQLSHDFDLPEINTDAYY